MSDHKTGSARTVRKKRQPTVRSLIVDSRRRGRKMIAIR